MSYFFWKYLVSSELTDCVQVSVLSAAWNGSRSSVCGVPKRRSGPRRFLLAHPDKEMVPGEMSRPEIGSKSNYCDLVILSKDTFQAKPTKLKVTIATALYLKATHKFARLGSLQERMMGTWNELIGPLHLFCCRRRTGRDADACAYSYRGQTPARDTCRSRLAH